MGKILLNYLPRVNIRFAVKYLRAVQKLKSGRPHTEIRNKHGNEALLFDVNQSLPSKSQSQVISDSTIKHFTISKKSEKIFMRQVSTISYLFTFYDHEQFPVVQQCF